MLNYLARLGISTSYLLATHFSSTRWKLLDFFWAYDVQSSRPILVTPDSQNTTSPNVVSAIAGCKNILFIWASWSQRSFDAAVSNLLWLMPPSFRASCVGRTWSYCGPYYTKIDSQALCSKEESNGDKRTDGWECRLNSGMISVLDQ